MTEVAMMRKMQQIIGKEENWCKMNIALTEDGRITDFGNKDCKRRCIYGAMILARTKFTKVGFIEKENVQCNVDRILNKAVKNRHYPYSLSSYNDRDTTTHADIMSLIEEGIQLAKRGDI